VKYLLLIITLCLSGCVTVHDRMQPDNPEATVQTIDPDI